MLSSNTSFPAVKKSPGSGSHSILKKEEKREKGEIKAVSGNRVSFSALNRSDLQIDKLEQIEQELRTSPDLKKMTDLFNQLKTIVGNTEIIDSACLDEWSDLSAMIEEIKKQEIKKQEK